MTEREWTKIPGWPGYRVYQLSQRWVNLTCGKRRELNALFALNRRLLKAYLLKESLDRLRGGVAGAALPALPYLLSLRRDQFCEPKLCPDAPEDGSRCDTCPLNRLDEAEQSEAGRLLRRALDLRAASRMGIQITLDDVAADEFQAMLILEEEREKR